MKSLTTLLRIAKRDLETLRRGLAQALARQGAIEESLRALAQSIAAEQKNAAANYEATRAYGGFALHATERRRALEAQAANIDAEIEAMRTLIAEAHVETRKFERLIELQEERDRAARDKRENAELDEMTTQRKGRKGVGQ